MSRSTTPSAFRRAQLALAACIVVSLTGVARADETVPILTSVPIIPSVMVFPPPAPADVNPGHVPVTSTVIANVDISEQEMRVYVDGHLVHVFKVSTGRKGYGTPTGEWQPEWLSRYHRSKKYHNAPMPWSVFYYGGFAIHGTTEVRRLGRPASHGCVRLLTSNAKIFYKLVQSVGKQNVRIAVVQ